MVILEFKHKKAWNEMLVKAKEAKETLEEIIDCLESKKDSSYDDYEEDDYYNERRGSRTSMRGRYGYK